MNKKTNWIWDAVFAVLGLAAYAVLQKIMGKAFRQEEITEIMKWWSAMLVPAIGFFPLAAYLFRKFSDKGYIFGKMLGFVIGGWLVWLLSSLHIVKFSATGSWVILILCIVVNYGLAIYLCKKKRVKLGEFFGITDGSGVIPKAIWYEVLFLAVFALLLYVKCFRPDFSWQTEGGMDYGFMISMMKTEYMPPEDFWYSGTDLNYYYLGQYFFTYLTKLSGVDIKVAYNLALMTVGALCVVLSYSLAARMFELYMVERTEEYRLRGKRTVASVPAVRHVLTRFAGFLAGFGVTFAATNHFWVYKKLAPILCEILGVDGNNSYWFSDPTRYIGWQGEAKDQTIHEFPAYSLVLGDLHAHVTNIIFVLTLLAVLFAFLLARRDRMKRAVAGSLEEINYKKEILNPHIIVLSFFIGIFQMTNFWDFPIYFVVCGAVILVSNAVICGFTKKSLLLTMVHAAEFIVISIATAFMFIIHFDSMASGIGICDRHTVPYQMIIVWGMPIAAVIAYLVINIKEEQKRRSEGVTETEHKNVFFAWLQNLKTSDLFLLIVGLCAVGLILMPELVYVKDIYGSDNQRTNTMFKLTYQAFILFGISMGVITTRLFLLPKTGKQFVAGALLLFLLCRDMEYFPYAWEAWAGDYKDPERYISLDSTHSYDVSEEDMQAAEWINENIEGRPTILEAHGPSYRTDGVVHCRMSALTGCPTVIGWRTHEWLWKGDVAAVDARAEDVEAIYACADVTLGKMLLEQYDVDYLYVGEVEFKKYKDEEGNSLLDYAYLRSLGEVVFEVEDDTTYHETFLVKIK